MDLEYLIKQYPLDTGALEIQYIEEFFGEFPRKKTAAEITKRLADREYVAGDYSIADMACYPWVLPERQGQNLDDFPHLKRWKAAIGERPAVMRAYALAKSVNTAPPGIHDDKSRAVLFGQDKSTVK